MAECNHRLRIDDAALEGRERWKTKVAVNSAIYELHDEIGCTKCGRIIAVKYDLRHRDAACMQCLENRAFANHVVSPLEQGTSRLLAEDKLLRTICTLQMKCWVTLASSEHADDDGARVRQQRWKSHGHSCR